MSRHLSGTSYDSNGNLLKDTFHTYSWDSEGHPVTIDSSACGTNGTCATYDALGRLVEKNVAGAFTQILYSPLGKLAIMNAQTLVNAYIPLPGGCYIQCNAWEREALAQGLAWERSFIHNIEQSQRRL